MLTHLKTQGALSHHKLCSIRSIQTIYTIYAQYTSLKEEKWILKQLNETAKNEERAEHHRQCPMTNKHLNTTDHIRIASK